MSQLTIVQPVSKARVWTGRILSAIPVVMLLLSGVMKLAKLPSVLQGFSHYGYSESSIVPIAALEIACILLYAIPRTMVLGAILTTAYLGGATASNARIGDPSWVVTVVLGILIWAGLCARDARFASLLPLTRRAEP